MSTSEKVVNEILDKGLASSTWAEKHQHAYHELIEFREDLVASVRYVLIKNYKQLVKDIESI